MAEGTMREFLVSLGYEVGNDKEWARALAKVEKGIAALAAALVAAEAGIAGMIVRVTGSLEQAHWAATRAGTTVGNLQALAYALEQTGRGSADPVSAFAAELRKFPGLENIARDLGVRTRVNGQIRDTMDLLFDVVEATKGMEYVRGAHTASLFGISEPDYEHLRRNAPQIRRFMAERTALAKEMGYDPAAGGLGSALAMQNYRSAMMSIEVAVSAMVVAVVPLLVPILDGLEQWIAENHEAIALFVTAFVAAAGDFLARLGDLVAALVPVGEAIGGIIEAATGQSGVIVAIEAITGIYLASVVLRILGVIGNVRLAILALVATVVTGRYVAPNILDMGVREAPVGPDERPRQTMFQRAVGWVREKTGMGRGGASGGAASPGGGEVTDRGGGDPGTAAIPANATTYSPQRGGDRMEGGYAAARKGPDGTAVVRTLEDYRLGRSQYATIAASRRFFGRKYTIPSVTYRVGDKVYTLKNVPVYVNDTGSAFVGAPEGRIDVPIDRDLGSRDTNQGLRGIELKPGWAPPSAPDASPQKTVAPWGNPADKIQTGPLIENWSDDSSVTTTRTTTITVHGDTNPEVTADDVAKAQSRVNADMITTTEQAVP